jgi:hypothetical protein
MNWALRKMRTCRTPFSAFSPCQEILRKNFKKKKRRR